MSTEKAFNAIRNLIEEANSGVLFLTDKIDKKRMLDVLGETYPEPCKANLNYLVSDEIQKNLPYP